MRIGIDGSCWANQRGFGRFTRCLVSEMVARHPHHDYVLVMDAPSAASVDGLPAGVDVRTVEVGVSPTRAAAADGSRRIGDMARMGYAARQVVSDAFFFPATYSYYPVPGRAVVVTVHDAIAEELPELVVPQRMDRLRWLLKQKVALWQARHIITVSDAARADVERRLGVAADRLSVVHEAPAPVFVPLDRHLAAERIARFGLTALEQYFVYVGGISPHKNLERLVQAFDEVRRDRPELRLVLVGEADDDPFLSSTESVRAAIAATGAPEAITFTGYVTDDELVALYSAAVGSVLPSLGEGYGLTAAESAACGTPVVASDLPVLRELLGEAGVFVDPLDPASIADGLRSIVNDEHLRALKARAGVERAQTWSWQGAADIVVRVLEEAAARA